MSRAQRIAIVLSSFEVSGAEGQALLLAEGLLRRHGREVLVASFAGGNSVVRRCADMGIPTLRLGLAGGRWPWLAGCRAAWSLRALRAFRPDVLLPFTLWPNVACALGRRSSGARAVLWNQRDEGVFTTYPHLSQVRWALRSADAVVANGSACSTWLTSQGVAAGRIVRIRNGCVIPVAQERVAVRRRYGFSADAPVILMLAHESARKDHATLVEAWALVRARLPSGALLVLAGRGAFDALRARIANLGVGESVRLTGPVEDVSGLLAASDLMVHASLGEGLPNAVIEALQQGLPVLGSDLPGLRDALGLNAAGRLVPPGNAPALAEAMLEAVRLPPSSAERMAVAAWARETYAVDTMVDAFAALLDQVAGAGAST